VGEEDAFVAKLSADGTNLGRDPAATGFNIWYVTRAADIDRARQGNQPLATGVTGCRAPAPAPGNSCTDVGALSRGAPTTFFYTRSASPATPRARGRSTAA
jgi:hypothetical protein